MIVDVKNYAQIPPEKKAFGPTCKIQRILRKKDSAPVLDEEVIEGTYDSSWPGEPVRLSTPNGNIDGKVNGLNSSLGFFTIKSIDGKEFYVTMNH